MRGTIVALCLVAAGPAYGQDLAPQPAAAAAAPDVVTLKNGDRLSGRIVKMVGGSLALETAAAGTIAISFADVASIATTRSLPIEFNSGETVTGRLESRVDGVYLVSDLLPAGVKVKPEEIVAIARPEPKIWSGSFRLGIGYSDGNTDTASASAGAEVRRKTAADTFRIFAETIYEERDGETSAQRTSGGSQYEYNFTERWYGKAFVSLENDRFKDLNLRTTVGAATGYKFVMEEDVLLQADVGPAYVNENYRSGTEDRDFVALQIGERFEWQISDGQSLVQTLQVFPNTEKFSDTLIQAAIAYKRTVVGNLFFDITLADEYDTEPAAGRKRNDFRMTAGLGYSF